MSGTTDTGVLGGIGALFSSLGDLAGLASGLLGQLQPASWRGQRFAVLGSTVRVGRRRALHEYPFRDGVWAEDLGKRGRLYGFDAFIVGDDVGAQVKRLLDALDQAGPGELVHPTLGARQCEVIEAEAADRWDAGGVWQLRLEFLEPMPSGLQLLPVAGADTAGQVGAAADDAAGAASSGFLDETGAFLKSGADGIREAVAAVGPYVATARRLAGDASGLVNAVRGLDGNFGRYGAGRGVQAMGIGGALRTARDVEAAVGGAIRTASTARAAVDRAGASLSALVDL